MRTGLYFGSFNPVHNGHLIIAQHIVNETDLAEVWFVVSPQNPFKNPAGLLHESHRYFLVQTAIEGADKLRASNIEFFLPKPSYTIDTLQYLAEKYPTREFAIIMGSDGFQNIQKWKNWEQIVGHYPIYIYKRPGFEVDVAAYAPAPLQVLEAPLLDISSTHIRSLIKAKKSIRYLVPDVVRLEIEKENYYKK